MFVVRLLRGQNTEQRCSGTEELLITVLNEQKLHRRI